MIPDSRRIERTWRSYFSQRCHPDVAALADDYPDRRSLYVDLVDLYEFDAEFTVAFFDAPARFLRLAIEVLRADYDAFDRPNVRVANNPAMFRLSTLGGRHVRELITVECVAESIASAGATLAVAVYDCLRCGETAHRSEFGVRLSDPGGCEACGGADPFKLRPGRSTFVDLARVSVVEVGDDSDGGRDPGTIDVFLADDVVDAVGPGDQFVVTGIVGTECIGPSNRFDLYIDGITVAEERSPVRAPSLAEVIQSRWESAVDD